MTTGIPVSVPPTPNLERRESSRRSCHESDQTQKPQSMDIKTSSTHSLNAKQNVFVWNGIITIDNPNQPGKKISIDRRSWITRLDEQSSQIIPVHYSLDKIGYPRYYRVRISFFNH